MNYKEKYIRHFGLTKSDFIIDEYEWVVNDRKVKAVQVHHIEHGSNKHDDITNLMALSYINHTFAHQEILKRDYLKQIHLDFLVQNPY